VLGTEVYQEVFEPTENAERSDAKLFGDEPCHGKPIRSQWKTGQDHTDTQVLWHLTSKKCNEQKATHDDRCFYTWKNMWAKGGAPCCGDCCYDDCPGDMRPEWRCA